MSNYPSIDIKNSRNEILSESVSCPSNTLGNSLEICHQQPWWCVLAVKWGTDETNNDTLKLQNITLVLVFDKMARKYQT